MIFKYTLLIGIAMTTSAVAQDLDEPLIKPPVSDEVQKAIDEFNRLKAEGKEKASEVTVVLDPPAPKAVGIKEDLPDAEATPEPEEASKGKKPILVTGKPPADLVEESPTAEENETLTETVPVVEEEPAEPGTAPEPEEPGLEVRVESIRKGSGKIDPSQVKLKASFPAKPLSSAPDGWILERSEQAPVFSKDVELQPGTTISLRIQPHVLVPDADGANTFSVGEPGFEAAKGYLQENTVSAILTTSVAQLDQDALKMGNAISELHQLLSSLPKPEEAKKP